MDYRPCSGLHPERQLEREQSALSHRQAGVRYRTGVAVLGRARVPWWGAQWLYLRKCNGFRRRYIGEVETLQGTLLYFARRCVMATFVIV